VKSPGMASAAHAATVPGGNSVQKIIETVAAPKPIGPYSQAIRAGGFVFLSGQIALDPETGNVVAGDTSAQALRVLLNLKAVLEASGSGLSKVVKTTIYLTDLNDFGVVNRVYGEFFGEVKPARSTVQVSRLPKEVRVEIDAIALV
jgi:2-iminobutanoate/2-iminopropanoate deaminase